MSSPTLSKVKGPDSMAKPESRTVGESSQAAEAEGSQPKPTKNPKKKHRAGKKRRNKQQTFPGQDGEGQRPSLLDAPSRSGHGEPFYRLNGQGSNTSLESEALLDHREHMPSRPRRQSLQQSGFTRPSLPFARHRGSATSGLMAGAQRSRLAQASGTAISEDEEEEEGANDRTPLLATGRNHSRPQISRSNSGHYGSGMRVRKSSVHSKSSSKRKADAFARNTGSYESDGYDINNPPSMPSSPQLGSLDDLMMGGQSRNSFDRGRDAVIDIDGGDRLVSNSSPDTARRRSTAADLAERDVCFPADGLSEIAEEDDRRSQAGSARQRNRRNRTQQWPDLSVLEEWSREEKEERTHQEHVRAKKISEPVMIGGRLRPGKQTWHREEDDAPFRFTYFNEMFDGTIHARTISDLLQEGATFKDLFLPDPVEMPEDSDDDEDENTLERPTHTWNSAVQAPTGHMPGDQQSRHTSIMSDFGEKEKTSEQGSKVQSRSETPSGQNSQAPTPRQYNKQKRYGPRPTFWLDVLQPTEMEMKVIAKAFGIHQLTTEDILMEEQREKVELFHSYYFLNYRSFEQDKESPDYMDPVNFYVVVFRDGVITFHHSQTPHPANVRRRIRQLNDYMSPTADWISYALIDDITDVYAPRVSQIEEEVDEIDEQILYLHVTSADDAEKTKSDSGNEKKSGNAPSNQGDMGAQKAEGDRTAGPSGGDLLRRVGEGRKKVMGLYRLLGNKADVIKGFAKRCNENWEVAPRSEIGLYLGDIQDHIVTMNNNLSHYENLLSRAHSNYVAQINIRMNERAEQNADILGKLTVIGTIVLPMNIVTGMWGMNVYVPGQEYDDNLTWFWCITAGLLAFGIGCYFIAKKAYGIV
ncbi:CorA metal ion transporter [Saxophila tyrrhenica]|uniref:CorA metal ion transporter n=1 Tax=Saxophila tyrrhenica TaxID=1690608 RepID=A0AAV9P7Z7_9PEZI|nr:CorA metal ion transporter [Saxophila tyrrhenica]